MKKSIHPNAVADVVKYYSINVILVVHPIRLPWQIRVDLAQMRSGRFVVITYFSFSGIFFILLEQTPPLDCR